MCVSYSISFQCVRASAEKGGWACLLWCVCLSADIVVMCFLTGGLGLRMTPCHACDQLWGREGGRGGTLFEPRAQVGEDTLFSLMPNTLFRVNKVHLFPENVSNNHYAFPLGVKQTYSNSQLH